MFLHEKTGMRLSKKDLLIMMHTKKDGSPVDTVSGDAIV